MQKLVSMMKSAPAEELQWTDIKIGLKYGDNFDQKKLTWQLGCTSALTLSNLAKPQKPQHQDHRMLLGKAHQLPMPAVPYITALFTAVSGCLYPKISQIFYISLAILYGLFLTYTCKEPFLALLKILGVCHAF